MGPVFCKKYDGDPATLRAKNDGIAVIIRGIALYNCSKIARALGRDSLLFEPPSGDFFLDISEEPFGFPMIGAPFPEKDFLDLFSRDATSSEDHQCHELRQPVGGVNVKSIVVGCRTGGVRIFIPCSLKIFY